VAIGVKFSESLPGHDDRHLDWFDIELGD